MGSTGGDGASPQGCERAAGGAGEAPAALWGRLSSHKHCSSFFPPRDCSKNKILIPSENSYVGNKRYCEGTGSFSTSLSAVWSGKHWSRNQARCEMMTSVDKSASCWRFFDSLALDDVYHKIFVVLASLSGLKELAEEGHVYLAIYNLYNLNLRGTLLIWNMDCTAKSDKLSPWRKGPCPLFSSEKNTAGWW